MTFVRRALLSTENILKNRALQRNFFKYKIVLDGYLIRVICLHFASCPWISPFISFYFFKLIVRVLFSFLCITYSNLASDYFGKNLSNSIYIYNKLDQVMQLAEHNRKS